jgi:hypothetical protein
MSAIESVLVENRVFPPSDARQGARISGMDAYKALCAEAASRLRRLLGPPGPRERGVDQAFHPHVLDESECAVLQVV